jgi:hypothetical protein
MQFRARDAGIFNICISPVQGTISHRNSIAIRMWNTFWSRGHIESTGISSLGNTSKNSVSNFWANRTITQSMRQVLPANTEKMPNLAQQIILRVLGKIIGCHALRIRNTTTKWAYYQWLGSGPPWGLWLWAGITGNLWCPWGIHIEATPITSFLNVIGKIYMTFLACLEFFPAEMPTGIKN